MKTEADVSDADGGLDGAKLAQAVLGDSAGGAEAAQDEARGAAAPAGDESARDEDPEAAPAGDESARDEDSESDEDGKALLKKEDVPDWTPEQRKYLNTLIGDRVAPYAGRAKAAAARVQALEAQVAEMQSVSDADTRAAIVSMGVLPDMVSADEAKVLADFGQAKAAMDFCRRHRRDGYEARDKSERSWTPDELEQKWDEWSTRFAALSPRAGAIQERAVAAVKAALKAMKERSATTAAVKPVKLPPPPVKPAGLARRGAAGGASSREQKKAEPVFDKAKVERETDTTNALTALAQQVALRALSDNSE